jgi:hypothetical protein
MMSSKRRRTLRRYWLPALVVLGSTAAFLGLLWLASANTEHQYAFLEDRLYVGSSIPQPPPGTKAVVNLCGREDRYPVEAVLWEPILEGGQEPNLVWLRRVVAFIDVQQRAGRTTYVHCMAGVNRSGMVVTAYLMYEHHWNRDAALAFVRMKRPDIGPSSDLMRLLSEWEKELNKESDGRGEGH